MLYFSIKMYGVYPWWQYLLYDFDLLQMTFVTQILVKMSVFISQIVMVVFFVTIVYLKELNQKFQIIILNYRKRKIAPQVYATLIRAAIREHHRLVVNFQKTNNDFWSSIIFGCVLSQLPVNVYMTANLLYGKSSKFVFVFVLLIFSVQCFAFSVTLYPLALTSKAYHSAHRYLVPAQSLLHRKYILLKCKLMAYFEGISSDNFKIAFTAGIFGDITPTSLFEVKNTNFYPFF